MVHVRKPLVTTVYRRQEAFTVNAESLTYKDNEDCRLQNQLFTFSKQHNRVNQHDFIFSNHTRHRVTRHASFWLACWIFFLISSYIPGGVLPAWHTENFTVNVARLGLLKWLWLRLINSSITFLPLLVFAYVVIYFLLPRHLFNKKNWFITIVLFVGMLLLILIMQYLAIWLVSWNVMKAKPGRVMLDHYSMLALVKQRALNDYPVVAGFAVIIKMMKRGWLKQQETEHIAREKARAELQLLKAQIHPHFLFNTLNNIYFFTLTASQKAPEILMKLSDILRYILNECSRPLVPLEKELKMVEDYMALEKIRYGDRLKMELEIKGDYSHKMIPPLLLIPLVENSFKHGTSKMLAQPWVNLNITMDNQFLYLLLSNSRPDEITPLQHNGHIGLKNVKKRLELLYPAAHELRIAESTQSFEVFMKVHLEVSNVSGKDVKTEATAYAVA